MSIKKSEKSKVVKKTSKLDVVKLTNRMRHPFILHPSLIIGDVPSLRVEDEENRAKVRIHSNVMTKYSNAAAKERKILYPNESIEVDKNAFTRFLKRSIAFERLLETKALVTDLRVKDVHESELVRPEELKIPIELTNEAQTDIKMTEKLA